MWRPLQRRHLRPCIDAVDSAARSCVPEVDVTIVTTAARGQQIVLPRAPAQSFDGSVVVCLLELGCLEGTGIPDADEVVVAARGELVAVGSPLKAAYFAGVGLKVGHLVLCDAYVVVEEPTVAGAGGENVLVPG